MIDNQLQEEVRSKNIIIALFWGYKFYSADKWWKLNGYVDHYWIKNPDGSVQRLEPKHFRFNWDWNWLIPVIKRITKMDFLNQHPLNHELIRTHANFCVNIKDKVMENDIEGAYDMVFDFVTFYNKK
jgi:hypothetical protein